MREINVTDLRVLAVHYKKIPRGVLTKGSIQEKQDQQIFWKEFLKTAISIIHEIHWICRCPKATRESSSASGPGKSAQCHESNMHFRLVLQRFPSSRMNKIKYVSMSFCLTMSFCLCWVSIPVSDELTFYDFYVINLAPAFKRHQLVLSDHKLIQNTLRIITEYL